MRSQEYSSNSHRRIYKQNQPSSLKQAGRSALNSASYIKEVREGYSSSTQSSSVLEDSPYVSSKSWCIFDGRTCSYQRGYHANEIREMASLTKMATLLTSLKLAERFKLDANSLYFSISENAATIRGTIARLQENEWVLVKDLYYGLMLPSGNDASIALAENFGCLLYFESIGKTDVFAEIHSVDVTEDIYVNDYVRLFLKEMNSLCEELQLKSTKFQNPHGLTNRNNSSTCNDLARLTFHCLKNEEFRKIVSTKIHKAVVKFVQFDNKVIERSLIWENTNILLNRPGFRGAKTGITQSAGGCLSSWFVLPIEDTKEECNIIIVVLGSVTQDERFNDTIRLSEWFYQRMKERTSDGSIYC